MKHTKERINGYSICVTAYKASSFIEDCLDSIHNQELFKNNLNYEILLGIDCCPETLEIVYKIKHKYANLKILYMDENKGTYITTNTLIKQSNFDKIIRFDSDDIMMPSMVKKIEQHMNNEIRPQIDICMFKAINFKNDINEGTKTKTPLDGVACHRWSVYELLGGYRPWRCAADSDFKYRISNKLKVKRIDDALYYRRIHENSLTQSPNTKHGSDIRNKYKKQLKKQFEKVEFVCNSFKIIE